MASRQVYARLRRRELLARLDFGIRLGLVLVPLGALSNVLFLSDRLPQRLSGFGALFVLIMVAQIAKRRPWVQRHAEGFVMAYMICVAATLVFLLSNSPEDLPVLVAPLSSVVVATPLMYPWRPRSQVVLATLTTLGFGIMAAVVSPPGGGVDAGFNFAMALLTMATLSVVVAWLLERHRFAAFHERRRVRALAIQRRRLMEIGRELRSTLDLEVLLPRLLSHARHVLPADWGSITIRDSGSGVYRIAAASGSAAGIEDLVGLQWAPEYAKKLLALFPPKELHALPGSPLDPLIMPSLRSYGAKSLVMAAVGSPQNPLAFITWVRSDGRSFTRAERRAALEMADQAHTALSAADLYGKALEASRLKSEFVSTISHEFRTPLSVIIGYAEMARDLELSLEERVHSLEGIEVSARELLLLVEQTLDIGRIEAGRSPIQLERIRLASFWTAMQEMCGLLPRKPGVRLVWSDAVPDVVRSDRRRIAIIVRNLVGNALKFTEQGTVKAHLAVEGSGLRIDVNDTGIGIRTEDRESIFEIFRQADGSETRRYDGTGLGLYIVSQFAHQLGGSVDVWSEPGRGSRFTIRIPCSERIEITEGATSSDPPLLAAMPAP
jgi:signal transduction histidine kinase